MTLKFKTNPAYYPYAVSKCGKIKNLKTGNIRATNIGKNGYPVFGTRDKGVIYVHRILAEVWIPNPYNKEQVNHIDGNKANSTFDNLEWVTRSENAIHAASNGLLVLNCKYGEECNLTKYSDDLVHSLCKDIEKGYRNVDISRKYGVPPEYIKELKSGKLRSRITSQYNSHNKSRRSLSEDTVRWVCERISEGMSQGDIVKLSTNPQVNINFIKNLRRKRVYTDISCDYF